MGRVAVPLKFRDGSLVRTLTNLKNRFQDSIPEIIIQIEGGEMERFLYGLAEDVMSEQIKTMKANGMKSSEIANELAQSLGVECTMDIKDDNISNIVATADDLIARINSNSVDLFLVRGGLTCHESLKILSAKNITGQGESASLWNISGLFIDIPKREEVMIKDLCLHSSGTAETAIHIAASKVSFQGVRFEGVRIEAVESSTVSLHDCSFYGVTHPWVCGSDSKIEQGNTFFGDGVENPSGRSKEKPRDEKTVVVDAPAKTKSPSLTQISDIAHSQATDPDGDIPLALKEAAESVTGIISELHTLTGLDVIFSDDFDAEEDDNAILIFSIVADMDVASAISGTKTAIQKTEDAFLEGVLNLLQDANIEDTVIRQAKDTCPHGWVNKAVSKQLGAMQKQLSRWKKIGETCLSIKQSQDNEDIVDSLFTAVLGDGGEGENAGAKWEKACSAFDDTSKSLSDGILEAMENKWVNEIIQMLDTGKP